MRQTRENFELIKLYGQQISEFIDEIASLRIEVFKEFPYLYKGSFDYEQSYLKRYTQSEKSLCVLVKRQGQIVGASTCLPLKDEEEDFQKPFLEKGYAVDKIFYLAESIIQQPLRGMGIGHDFFRLRHEHAKNSIPELEYTTFCAVERSKTHPLRPKDYKDLSSFWSRLGYNQNDKLSTQYAWPDIGEREQSYKKMNFWLKSWC